MFAPKQDRSLRLTLYSKPDCPLCDEMKAQLAQLRPRYAFELSEVDIRGQAELERSYGLRIPVLAIGGAVACEGRASAADLERALARGAGDASQRGGGD